MANELLTEITKNKKALESLIIAIRDFKEDYMSLNDNSENFPEQCAILCYTLQDEIDKNWTDNSLLDMQIALGK